MGHFSSLNVAGVPVQQGETTGKSFYVDCRTAAMGGKGADGNDGLSMDKPKATLAAAYGLTLSGRGDTVYLISADDTATSVFRTATAGLTWANDNTHLVGICAPTWMSQRARIAPPTASTTCATTLTISGGNCRFENLQIQNGHSGNIDQFACKVTGQRNYFKNCHFQSPGHATTANRAGSMTLVIDGGTGTFLGEHTFEDCVVGSLTILRSAANANVQFLNFATRVKFKDCYFPCVTDDATALFVIAAAGSIQDVVLFDNCVFHSEVNQSGATAMVHAIQAAATAGGDILLHNCGVYGISGTLVDGDNAPVYTNYPASAATGAVATRITHA